ncbi:MAG TPA: LytTR family DNA-binding domain-containing protein [Puia sp.]|jgi:two-component system LytT family response regulator|nr:LytTR family DNA-binding domain-containing protein [Puia sp.]
MLRCIAVDDEPLALQLLEDYIRKVPLLELVASCGDAFEAARALQANTVDLIFIDIQMPGLTGLQFIQSLAKRPMVILITAYKKFATEGFDLDVVDYLVKPMGLDRFMKACFKAQELHQLRTGNTGVGAGASAGAGAGAGVGAAAEFFFVNVDYSLVKVLFADIVWIEGSGDYVKIHLRSSAKVLMVRTSAKTLEGELPADKFIRIHKSYIVSVAGITAVRKNSVFIGELELPVGETYREGLRQITGREL